MGQRDLLGYAGRQTDISRKRLPFSAESSEDFVFEERRQDRVVRLVARMPSGRMHWWRETQVCTCCPCSSCTYMCYVMIINCFTAWKTDISLSFAENRSFKKLLSTWNHITVEWNWWQQSWSALASSACLDDKATNVSFNNLYVKRLSRFECLKVKIHWAFCRNQCFIQPTRMSVSQYSCVHSSCHVQCSVMELQFKGQLSKRIHVTSKTSDNG